MVRQLTYLTLYSPVTIQSIEAHTLPVLNLHLSIHNFFISSHYKTAGRPGGPDFYVSTVDNTFNHGPGGQSSYAIASEADPCFGKVIEGFAAVDRMHKMSVQPGGYKRMNYYVAIKSAKILSSEL